MTTLQIISLVIVAIYSLVLVYIAIFCLWQFQLLYFYRKKKKGLVVPNLEEKDYPVVTVQLPIFNEMYVVERLIDKLVELDYPKDKLEIQVLDDSTDETIEISKRKVAEYKAKGFDISLLHRKDRKGYKAGALLEATKVCKGEFIAIFDADFLPKPDFLKATLPHFQNPKIGVVQTRWEHINEDYSLITRLQALALNVHFTVEQSGREKGNCMLQFNGTAGVWRRATIEDAGGWQADTLTEDLDLSYRAQLKGWEIFYREDIGSPAELPAEMISFKSQQFRWMKGGAETAKKLLPKVWRSSLGFRQKVHATLHLLGSSIFLFIFALGLLSVPLIYALNQLMLQGTIFSIFIVSTLSIICIYFVANVTNPYTSDNQAPLWKKAFKFLFLFPLFLSLSMGLSLHNSWAVIQGWLGKKSAFIRTPKFNLKSLEDKLENRKYIQGKISPQTIMEGAMSLYFIYGIYYGIQKDNTSLIIFHLLLAIGYGIIFYYSIRDLRYRT